MPSLMLGSLLGFLSTLLGVLNLEFTTPQILKNLPEIEKSAKIGDRKPFL